MKILRLIFLHVSILLSLSELQMELGLRELLGDYYELDVDRLIILKGGYRLDETYLCCTTDHQEYLVKYIRYSRPTGHLRSILEFQNHLQDCHDYPCSRILP